MKKLTSATKNFDFSFPKELIANRPQQPRDSCRLLFFDRRNNLTRWGRFFQLPAFLPKKAVIVFNDTKVFPARLILKRTSGGRVKVLYLKSRNGLIEVWADRNLKINERLTAKEGYVFKVLRKKRGIFFLKPIFALSQMARVLQKHGLTPIPPYIKDSPLSERQLRQSYQSIFAKKSGSVAAPTASLHFSTRLLKALKRSGAVIKKVTLHVNLGTFAPINEEQWQKGRLHQEEYRIDSATVRFLEKAKRQGRPIIAVGTTVCRALESAVENNGRITHPVGKTGLFIRDGYQFKFIDGLITNFHVPKSSLLMLVCAFAGRKKVLELYRQAIGRKFRLFSFGDAMFILR